MKSRDFAALLRWELQWGGFWPPGHKLPSHRELATRFGTSRATVLRALIQLTEEGIVDIVPGKGAFIAGGPAVNTSRSGDAERQLRAFAQQITAANGSKIIGRTQRLAAMMAVSDSTMRRVVRKLVDEGVLRRRRDGYVEAA